MKKENVKDFMNSAYCRNLAKDILHAERLIHHATDNYRINMPDSLEKALGEAEKSLQLVLSELLTEYRQEVKG